MTTQARGEQPHRLHTDEAAVEKNHTAQEQQPHRLHRDWPGEGTVTTVIPVTRVSMEVEDGEI